MTARKVISGFAPSPLPIADVQNGAAATVDIIRAWAGNTMSRHAWATGDVDLPGDTPSPCPVAPGGTGRGHDHSGGRAGRPLYRSIFSRTASPHDLLDTGVTGYTTIEHGTRLSIVGMTSTGVTYGDQTAPFGVWVPGCDPGPYGAYSRLGVTLIGHINTAVTDAYTDWDADDTVRVHVVNLHPDLGDEATVYWDWDMSVGPHSQASEVEMHSGNADNAVGGYDRTLPAVPGEMNPIALRLTVTKDATAASAAEDIAIWLPELEFGVNSDTI